MGCICSGEEEGPINQLQVDQSHFTMMKVVGKGGFGKVNAVSHRLTGSLMAMKRMKKSKLVSKKMYVVTAWRERDVMAQLKSPFLVNLVYAFQDKVNLFLIMPFMQGGDLRYYLTTRGKMNEDMCKFYIAEVILGLEELHQKNIVYRDLKPDNVLLDSTGHLRISDFGLAVFLKKESGYKVSGGAGTPGYQAPEVLNKQKYGVSADIWSLGITIYELLERQRPFASPEESLTQERVHFHHQGVSREAKDLIRGMLTKDPNKRLGCGPRGLEELKSHKWFAGIDWDKMNRREIKPPFQPELDRANCSADYELQDQFFSEKKEPDLSEEEQANFKHYEFNVEIKGPIVLPSKKSKAVGSGGVMGETGGRTGQLVVVSEREAKMPQHLQDAATPKSEMDDDPALMMGANVGMGAPGMNLSGGSNNGDSKDAKQQEFVNVHRDSAPAVSPHGQPVIIATGGGTPANLLRSTSSNGRKESYVPPVPTATVAPAPDEPVFVINNNNPNSARKTLVDGSEKKSHSDSGNTIGSTTPTIVVVGERKSVVARKSSASAETTGNTAAMPGGVSSDGRAELSAVRLGEGSGTVSPVH